MKKLTGWVAVVVAVAAGGLSVTVAVQLLGAYVRVAVVAAYAVIDGDRIGVDWAWAGVAQSVGLIIAGYLVYRLSVILAAWCFFSDRSELES